jgi:mannose-6-phosphate isomerase-like protein (cupin superfamily)
MSVSAADTHGPRSRFSGGPNHLFRHFPPLHANRRYVKSKEKPSGGRASLTPVSVPPLLGGSLRGSDFTIHEWSDDGQSSAERPIAPLHVHDRDDEAWYVLEGALGFRLGEETVEARAGSGVLVPAGTAHTYWNAGGGPARYLLVLTPRIAALIEALHAPDRGELEALFRRFDSRLL